MQNIRETLKNEKLRDTFNAIKPAWMSFDAEVGFAVQIIEATDANKQGSLHNIAVNNPRSLSAAIYNVAACGLSLDPSKKEAYLTVRRGNLIFDPSYIGMCRLATDTGSILWVQAETVHQNEPFKLTSVDEKPIHERDPFDTENRGATIGYYCVVKVHNGDYLTTTMDMDEIGKIKGSGGGGNVWKQWPDEMGKKSVIRRAHKLWPVSDNHEAASRLAAAVHVGNLNEDQAAPVLTAPEVTTFTDTDKQRFDQIITNNDALEMYVFQQVTGEGIFASLYNSFEKGSVTKYKRIVDGLLDKGRSSFMDYKDSMNPEDDLGMEEIKSEVSEACWDLLTK